jgi:hypothetical protein
LESIPGLLNVYKFGLWVAVRRPLLPCIHSIHLSELMDDITETMHSVKPQMVEKYRRGRGRRYSTAWIKQLYRYQCICLLPFKIDPQKYVLLCNSLQTLLCLLFSLGGVHYIPIPVVLGTSFQAETTLKNQTRKFLLFSSC